MLLFFFGSFGLGDRWRRGKGHGRRRQELVGWLVGDDAQVAYVSCVNKRGCLGHHGGTRLSTRETRGHFQTLCFFIFRCLSPGDLGCAPYVRELRRACGREKVDGKRTKRAQKKRSLPLIYACGRRLTK